MSSAGNAFNGNLGNGAVFTSSGSTLTTGSITINDSIEFYHNRPQKVGINVTINGITYNLPGPYEVVVVGLVLLSYQDRLLPAVR